MTMGLIFKGEPWREHAVQESFQQGRHRSPPSRKNKHQMIGSADQILGPLEVIFQRLIAWRWVMHIRIELQFAQDKQLSVNATRRRTLRESTEQRPSQTIPARVSQNHQYLHRRLPGAVVGNGCT